MLSVFAEISQKLLWNFFIFLFLFFLTEGEAALTLYGFGSQDKDSVHFGFFSTTLSPTGGSNPCGTALTSSSQIINISRGEISTYKGSGKPALSWLIRLAHCRDGGEKALKWSYENTSCPGRFIVAVHPQKMHEVNVSQRWFLKYIKIDLQNYGLIPLFEVTIFKN